MFEFIKCHSKALCLVLALAITGCASPTLTPEDCALGAWYAVGNDDGLQGKDSDLILRHKKACSKYGIEVSSSEYMDGYRAGNKVYCDSYNHYGAGAVGDDRVPVCPGEPYESQYRKGIAAYCESFDHHGAGKEGQVFNSRCPEYPYRQQHREGVDLYCAGTNPYELGRRYGDYQGVCSSDFQYAYELGERSLYLESRIEETQDELSKKIRQLIDENDPEKTELIKKQVKLLEEKLKRQRKELLELKIQVHDLGYLDEGDILGDLIDLVL